MYYFKQLSGGILILFSLFLISCKDDPDPMPIPTGNTETFDLASVSDPNISGTAEFIENKDKSTTINLKLSGTPSGGMHPAHIHLNTAAEGGDIVLTLGTVMGGTGTSSVTVSKLDDGSAISYSQLINFDGYINVHVSASDLKTLVAQGDIGENKLTGKSKTYALGTKAVAGIKGTATFSQRVNEETLVKIMLEGTPDGGKHPSHIHINTAAKGGAIAVTFIPIDGTTGMSVTNVSSLDDKSAITYDELLAFDGYINVHLSAEELGTLVAQGDIGQNELTGKSKVYTLGEKDVPGIKGTATFKQRVNGSTLALLEVQNTIPGSSHPAHIHSNSAAVGGPIVISFTPVDGSTGMSLTDIVALDDKSAITYDQLLTYNGYLNVHLSMAQLGVIVAQGNIGSNAN